MGVLSLVRSWSQTILKEISSVRNSKTITTFIESHFDAAVDFVKYNCKEKVPTSGIQLISELLNLFSASLQRVLKHTHTYLKKNT